MSLYMNIFCYFEIPIQNLVTNLLLKYINLFIVHLGILKKNIICLQNVQAYESTLETLSLGYKITPWLNEHSLCWRKTNKLLTQFEDWSKNYLPNQPWIAQLVAHWLGNREDQGSNPGKGDNFSMKIINYTFVKITPILQR